jgi:hypothetical protein
MSLYRIAPRIDANQTAIVAAFRKLGCAVEIITKPVDLAVARNGRTLLVEVKDGAKSPSQRRLTPAQQKFRDSWPDMVPIVESIADVEYVVRAFFPADESAA